MELRQSRIENWNLRFFRDTSSQLGFLLMMLCIDAIITEHLEMFFRDVDDQTHDEI